MDTETRAAEDQDQYQYMLGYQAGQRSAPIARAGWFLAGFLLCLGLAWWAIR